MSEVMNVGVMNVGQSEGTCSELESWLKVSAVLGSEPQTQS